MIKAKAEKAAEYRHTLDCYLCDKDKSSKEELWLFAEDVLPCGDIDRVVEEVLEQFKANQGVAGLIYARDKTPLTLSDSIDDIRFIFNSN